MMDSPRTGDSVLEVTNCLQSEEHDVQRRQQPSELCDQPLWLQSKTSKFLYI